MSVIERIERGELSLQQQCEDGDICSADKEQSELLRLAKIGAKAEMVRSGLESIRDEKYMNPHLVADRLLRIYMPLPPLPEGEK